jgi:hypothetical protein
VLAVATGSGEKVRVRWGRGPGIREAWLSRLASVAVREGDRVLLLSPDGWDEPLVVGVIDGFSARPCERRAAGARLTLKADEALRIDGSNGEPLVEMFSSATGPVVRLCSPDVRVDVPGALAVTAKSVSLRAEKGSVDIAATDEVRVSGERVKLN